ncbi:DEAD/DEAH box helicase [Falsibacillus pallidus]|uniref:Superfamily II DNA/RNA helicase n=1 Tax=Falsibacillus pallidus TaxID=493781 RepID=A0A370GIW3_9BACI|nr:DEAD/DEAH box helicase [Falsibacillus pallidus]RDI42324.1 superfamily II DNA/RNA helicase [Falsibacillus pallidus]
MTNAVLLENLKPSILAVWEKEGFSLPTSIQMKAIPEILSGKDLIAQSPTGTGKTLAYLLPVISKVDADKQAPQALILASSQELVMQIFQEVQKWTEGSGLKAASIIGGANVKRQQEKLKKHPQIIVGTPGRVLELIKQKKLKMHEMKTLVLDEGDQLLVPEHLETIQTILKSTLKDQRQVLLFSATLTERSEQIGKELMESPELIKVEKDETIESDVDHIYFVCEPRDKQKILEKIARLEDVKALAFVKDIGEISVLNSKLKFKELPVGMLHSELKKDDRKTYLKDFRNGKINMLLATDVAARGLDIKGVTHVVHFDFPKELTQYVHRSGRTGRFGADGTVISIVTDREERELKQFAKELGIEVEKKEFYKGGVVDARS